MNKHSRRGETFHSFHITKLPEMGLTTTLLTQSKWFTREYHPTFRPWSRQDNAFGDENAFEHTLENIKKMRGADVQPFLKPIVVLSSPRTFSAAEDFLVAFKPLKRGLIVGEPSGGSTGQPLIISLPGGLGSRGRPCEELLAMRLPMTVSAVLWITLKRKVYILPSLTSN